MLWSFSPVGEAKMGLPYALLNGLDPWVALAVCFAANALVFPLMYFFIQILNRRFLHIRFYKRWAVWVAQRAKKAAGKSVAKHGFWGLLFFVMVPLPGTGVYAGAIASYLFRLPMKKAFLASTIGIFFSTVMVWGATMLATQI